MIKTNLLPYRAARKKENIRRQLSVFVLFFIFITLALAFYHFHLAGRLNSLEDVLSNRENELKTFEAKAKEVDSIKAQLAVLEKKLGVMEQLNKDRLDAFNLMAALVDLTIRGRMWITSVKEKGNSVSLDGIAVDNKTVAVFMAKVESSDYFSTAVLKDVVLTEQSGLQLKQFSLVCPKSL